MAVVSWLVAVVGVCTVQRVRDARSVKWLGHAWMVGGGVSWDARDPRASSGDISSPTRSPTEIRSACTNRAFPQCAVARELSSWRGLKMRNRNGCTHHHPRSNRPLSVARGTQSSAGLSWVAARANASARYEVYRSIENSTAMLVLGWTTATRWESIAMEAARYTRTVCASSTTPTKALAM
eukprot:m.109887 g.109887  ORF g.109887 m.109887 type:complete len:181 (+) comp21287_c1_seq3:93-635(+)